MMTSKGHIVVMLGLALIIVNAYFSGQFAIFWSVITTPGSTNSTKKSTNSNASGSSFAHKELTDPLGLSGLFNSGPGTGQGTKSAAGTGANGQPTESRF